VLLYTPWRPLLSQRGVHGRPALVFSQSPRIVFRLFTSFFMVYVRQTHAIGSPPSKDYLFSPYSPIYGFFQPPPAGPLTKPAQPLFFGWLVPLRHNISHFTHRQSATHFPGTFILSSLLSPFPCHATLPLPTTVKAILPLPRPPRLFCSSASSKIKRLLPVPYRALSPTRPGFFSVRKITTHRSSRP